MRSDLEEVVGSIDDRSSTILFTSGRAPDGGLTLERARNLKNAGLFACRSVWIIKMKKQTTEGGLRVRINWLCGLLKTLCQWALYTVSSIVVDGKNFEELEEYIHYMGQVEVHGIRILDIVPSRRIH